MAKFAKSGHTASYPFVRNLHLKLLFKRESSFRSLSGFAKNGIFIILSLEGSSLDEKTEWLGCPIIFVHLKSIKTAVWPDVAKLCHSDKMLKVHAIFDGVYFVFGQIMNLLWQFFSRHWANFHWHKWPIIEQLFKHSIRTEINSGLSSLLWQASSTRLSLCESQFRQNLQ